tara:strand:+ start:4257 stop:5231 length:975 start_codon:yes stop_codon:yes gene_type:complete
MAWSLDQLSRISGGETFGDKKSLIIGLCSSEKPIKNCLAFSLNEKTSRNLDQAGCFVISKEKPSKGICHPDPKLAFSSIVNEIRPNYEKPKKLISEKAHISKSAKIDQDVEIGPFVFIGEDVKIGKGTEIHAFSFIGNKCKIGSFCKIMPHAVIMDNCNLGDKCLIGPSSVVGNSGFNIHKTDKEIFRMPHIGGVQIQKNATIGALNTIDGGLIDPTGIGKNVKTDSQVHIAHNVNLGDNALIAAKSGIAGSSKIKENFIAGGRVGVSDHTKIGKNVTAGVGSMIISDIEDDSTVLGYPARAKKITLSIWASLKKLPVWIKKKK